METAVMGKVVVAAQLENLGDLLNIATGQLSPDKVRKVEVSDALVDTGAMLLSMPKRLIEQLGLVPVRKRWAQTTNGRVERTIYNAVRLTIQGRDCTCDVAELPDDCPVLIGQIPLEGLDFIVDPVGQRLLGNPAHGGEQMIDLF
ncbi:MAG: retroviral-like aspartic protease family protein [Planctomycetales bacterium]|nr:retroviral-like aspartic protease family protein [Planctomycetales bacterium]